MSRVQVKPKVGDAHPNGAMGQGLYHVDGGGRSRLEKSRVLIPTPRLWCMTYSSELWAVGQFTSP